MPKRVYTYFKRIKNVCVLTGESDANTFILVGGRLATASTKDTKVNRQIDDRPYSKNSTFPSTFNIKECLRELFVTRLHF